MAFTHLRVTSGYSFMQSTVKLEYLINKAQQLGMKAIALTDRGNMHAAYQFYQLCRAKHIQPIIGLSLPIKIKESRVELLLYAKNNQGYRQLMNLSSSYQLNEEPLELEQLHAAHSGLKIILPLDGFGEEMTVDEQLLVDHLALLPEGVLCGITPHRQAVYQAFNTLQDVSIAIGDVRYLEAEEHEALSYLMKMNKAIDQRPINEDYPHHFFTTEEARVHFEASEALLAQTVAFVQDINVNLDQSLQRLPRYPLPSGTSPQAYLKELTSEALTNYYGTNQKASARLAHELSIIENMGFSDYFLIVFDFVRFAKEQGIRVGPGRGSAAGSIVSFLLGITTVDPLKYDLLFERFLNPERVTMPDIDIDFTDYRREEVIDYVKEKYGKAHVAQIATFGTFKVRSIIRELAKVYPISDHELNYILRQLPATQQQSLVEAVKQSDALISYIKKSETLPGFFRVARTLEDLPRNLSTHAAGVVMHDEALIETVPLTTDGQGHTLTQYPMGDLEKIGLLKMDFLGLRNLTIIERITKQIQREAAQFDIDNLPLDDPLTFKLLQTGDTSGVFQLESKGMREVLRNLKPTVFEDIVAVNALYRPGPMDFIDTYVKRKHHEAPVEYLHPDLATILKPTHGVLVYQEQIMQIAHQFAGLSLGKADILRRAISKKNKTELDEVKAWFVEGCLAKGYDNATIEELFSWITRFANYGFNRSHAVSYSLISYQLAYLKANYSLYFYAELLNSVTGQADKIHHYFRELRLNQLTLYRPNINQSFYGFKVEAEGIRMGLGTIKGIGYPVVNSILETRTAGPFQSLFDFCLRVPLKVVNRKMIQTLVLAGCFDIYGVERASVLATIDTAMEQGELFGDMDEDFLDLMDGLQMDGQYEAVEPFEQMEKLQYEKELLGVYLNDHPLKMNRTQLRRAGYLKIFSLEKQQGSKRSYRFAGFVQEMRVIRTKRGESMAFVVFNDEDLEIDGVIFPDVLRNIKPWFEEQVFVDCQVRVEDRQGKLQLIVEEATPLNFEKIKTFEAEGVIYVKFSGDDLDGAIQALEEIAKDHPGPTPVKLYHEPFEQLYALSEAFYLVKDYQSIKRLTERFGKEHVVYKEKREKG